MCYLSEVGGRTKDLATDRKSGGATPPSWVNARRVGASHDASLPGCGCMRGASPAKFMSLKDARAYMSEATASMAISEESSDPKKI